ncbi:MAG: (2Fe-2S) ferredoxin domain-containing protein [Anaerolineales bacterium]
MPAIKSLEELKRIREEALQKRQLKSASGEAQVIVAMGTCGIAAGARDVMKSVLNYLENNQVSGVTVSQTGCIGLCDHEPIVQVVLGEQPKVTYGDVTPALAERILREHVQNGKILAEHTLTV